MTLNQPSMEPTATDFLRLFTRHERPLRGYILSLVPNWADADEIFQETSIRLWQQFGQYDPGRDFAVWARSIAFYEVLTCRKKRSREHLKFSQAFLDAVTAEVEETGQEQERLHQALAECLIEVGEVSRQLIHRVYAGGETIKQIAESMGRSLAATYKAVARIRFRLYECVLLRLGINERT